MRVAALATAVFLAAFALGFGAGSLRPRPSTSNEPATPSSKAPTHSSNDKRLTTAPERDHTEHGARATALAYASASQDWLYLSDQEIEASVTAIATAPAAASLSAETVAELRTARQALARSPGRVWWLVRPLASRVERFDPASARVVVWTVSVLSASDVALPQADWARVAVDLTWVEDAWRLQAIADTPGPTPMAGTKDRPWQPEALDEALAGFERVSTEVHR